MHTRFILLNTSHAGNVGAVARAMKVMGFDDLVLVRPRWSDVLMRPEAVERASGADDVLRRARIVQTWEEAVEGIEHLCATAMTPRDFGPPSTDPRTHFAWLAHQAGQAGHAQAPTLACPAGIGTSGDAGVRLAAAPIRSVGLVFGSERYGMRNDEVYRCHVCLRIPANPDYGSLNLAAAAQVLAYEWRMALGGFGVDARPSRPAPDTVGGPVADARAASIPARADAAQVEAMLAHWQQALQAIGYLNPAAPKKLMPRLQQLFHRAALREEEIHILRGIAKSMQQAAQQPGQQPTQQPAPKAKS